MSNIAAALWFLLCSAVFAGQADQIMVPLDTTNCVSGSILQFIDTASPLGCPLPSSMGPTASVSVPSGGSGTGTAGSAGTYVPGNAAPRQTVQRTTVNTDASGNWSVTFSPGFVSSTPTINPIPLNASSTTPIICNVMTRSATTQTGHCWQVSSQTVALISLTISLAPTVAPTSTPIMVIGAEPTQ